METHTMSTATATTYSPAQLDQLAINTIRFLSVDAVQQANSGHPGLPLGAAPMAYVVWTRFLRHNPANPRWFDRDRFILSAGHGSMLLYSLLHLTGYDLPLEHIKQFRQWGSNTPGHAPRKTLIKADGQSFDMPFVQCEAIAVGEAVVQNLPVGIYEVLPDAPAVSGILGVDFLEHFTVTLD